MQIKTEESWDDAFLSGTLGTGAFIFGGSYAFGVLGKIVNLPGLAIIATASVASGGLKAVGAYNDQEVSVGLCGEFSGGDEKKDRYGCSAVVPVDYNNIGEVNSVCKKIEGNP